LGVPADALAERAHRLLAEGTKVLPRVAWSGAVDAGELRATLADLTDVTRAQSERQELARHLVDAAGTALTLGEAETADVLLGEAVASTLAIYPDKDYQLSSWIELLRPRLDRDDGPQLADWLAGVILDVRDDAGSSQASDAAKRLIAGESRMRPGATWRLSSWLEDHDVLDRDDRMLCLLEGTQERADCPLWWIALAEGVLPIASALPEWSLKRPLAVATSIHGPSWAAARVRELVARVEVEVPPGLREEWRWQLADAVVDAGLDLAQAGLPTEAHPDRRAPRSRSRGTGEETRDAYLAAHNTPETVLQALRDGARDSLDRPWGEAFERVAPRLTEVQFDRFLTLRDAMDVNDRIVLIGVARRFGRLALARELIEEGLNIADSSGWRRYYDGGTVLKLMTALWEFEPQEGRRRAYARLATDASTNWLLLASVAEDLKPYRDLFGIDDDQAVADAVEAYVRLLVRDRGASRHATDTRTTATPCRPLASRSSTSSRRPIASRSSPRSTPCSRRSRSASRRCGSSCAPGLTATPSFACGSSRCSRRSCRAARRCPTTCLMHSSAGRPPTSSCCA
jgi:hypothetical protein